MSENYFDEEKPFTEVSIQYLNNLGKGIFEQRKKYEEAEANATKERIILDGLKSRMVALLEQNGHQNFSVPGEGKLQIKQRLSVRLPKTPEAKEAFYNYLKEKNIFENMVTIHSQTLNAFYKTEMEIAISEGRSIGFEIPGIDKHETLIQLAMTSKGDS